MILFFMTNADDKTQTINTYNKSALAHAKKFNDMGARVDDIKKTFSYIKKQNPKTVEIGCGSGRDAKEIVKYTNDFIGIDLSAEMIKLARESVPGVKFELADLETYNFPKNTDVCFSFASILHSDRESIKILLGNICRSLSNQGVIFISSKYGDYHREVIDKEGHGPKAYYFYTPEEIEKLSPSGLRIIFREVQEFGGQKWFSVIFQKSD